MLRNDLTRCHFAVPYSMGDLDGGPGTGSNGSISDHSSSETTHGRG
jgi:hypothetical protein